MQARETCDSQARRPGAGFQTCTLQAGCNQLLGDTPWDDACRQANESNANVMHTAARNAHAQSSSKFVIPRIGVHPQLMV